MAHLVSNNSNNVPQVTTLHSCQLIDLIVIVSCVSLSLCS